ncbi:MAG: hypothetical protein IJS15_08020 [Victivallales bacterium]|nr:hypothetical protein [Victivallales bacterium]
MRQRLLFWNAPARGAFFGVTSLLLFLYACFTAFCGCMVIDDRMFCFGATRMAVLALLLPPTAYILFLLGRAFFRAARITPHFGWRLLKAICVVGIIVGIGIIVLFYALPVERLSLNNWPEWAECSFQIAIIITVLIAIVFIFRPIANPAKLAACLLCWRGCYLVFSTLLCTANPFTDREPVDFRTSYWLGDSLLHVPFFYKWFHLGGGGSLWFTLAGFALLIAAYILTVEMLAHHIGCPMRDMFTRGIRVQLWTIAALYALSLSMALWETAGCRRAIAELERHFDLPLVGSQLGYLFYKGREADAEFWQKMSDALTCFQDKHDAAQTDNEYEFRSHPDAVLPKELYEERRGRFFSCLEESRIEELLKKPLPPNKRDYGMNFLLGMPHPEISHIRDLSEIERRRFYYTLDYKKLSTAIKSIENIDTLCDYLCSDYYGISQLVLWRILSLRNEMLVRLMESGLQSNEWLKKQFGELQKWDDAMHESERWLLYAEAVLHLDALRCYAKAQPRKEMELNLTLNGYPLRVLFPQAWWLAADNVKAYAKSMKVSEIAELPREAVGKYLVDAYAGNLSYHFRRRLITLADLRIAQGLVMAELQKRRTGEYPDTIENLPTDPFSNQPLKYRKGLCQITRHYCIPKEKDDPEEEDASENVEWCFEKREETVDAVQIWSVGENGKDDGGVTKTDSIETWRKVKDDIRRIIQIR